MLLPQHTPNPKTAPDWLAPSIHINLATSATSYQK